MARTFPALDLRFAPGPGAGTLQDFLYAELDPFQPAAIQENEAADGWRVFFRTSRDRDAARGVLQSEFGGALLDLTSVNVPDEDWARRSQAELKAVRVGRITVAPPWDVPDSPTPKREPRTANPELPNPELMIVIEPSMGFGTGHHATTRLCLQLLQAIELAGRRVIDVGTGSGVLALAAWKLGAASIIAIDCDPDALQNARTNVERNGAHDVVELRQLDLLAPAAAELPRADVVLANLTTAALQRCASVLRGLVNDNGSLILSGFSPLESGEIVRSFDLPAARLVSEGDWGAVLIHSR